MSFSAIQSAGDAIDVTREYLLARTLKQGLLLGLMAIFLGPTGVSGPPGPIDIEDEVFEFNEELPTVGEIVETIDWELAMLVLIGATTLAVLYGLVSAFMEFGFIHSLTTDTVAIRSPARDHWQRAISLFLFRAIVWGAVAMGSVTLLAVGLGVFTLPAALDVTILAFSLVVGGLGVYLLNRLTTDFVVPIMYHERRGILSSWKRLLGVMRREWRQYLGYIPIRIILEIALGIAFGIVLLILLIATGIIVGVPLGVLTVLLLGVGTGLVITFGVLILLAMVLIALVMVPFHTYLRYYTLLVLGDTNPTLDLIPVKRSQTRDTTDELS